MSDVVADLEKQKVSLGTVIKVGTSLVGFIVFVTGVYFRLEAMEKATDRIEANQKADLVRIENLERNVIWRRE